MFDEDLLSVKGHAILYNSTFADAYKFNIFFIHFTSD